MARGGAYFCRRQSPPTPQTLQTVGRGVGRLPCSRAVCAAVRVRAPHTTRRETDGEGGAAAAAQLARGARDRGAEQPSAPCAVRRPGEGAAGDGARDQPTPGVAF